jgi:hypothetical protein
MKYITVFVTSLMLMACVPSNLIAGLTVAGEIDTMVVKTIATEYCKLPLELRQLNRERINKDIAPNKIELTCKE